MMTRETFLDCLSKALYHLYEPDRLGRSPLAELFGVANRPDTFAVLQRILTGAIEALEPGANEPPASSAWQIYEPLYYRFVQQLDQEQVARQLGMSVRHLRRKEHAAIEVLAAHLWQKYGLETTSASAASALSTPSINEELAWLRDTQPESPVDLNRLLNEVADLVRTLAHQGDVQLDWEIEENLPALPVHEAALNQLLLNLFSMVVPAAKGGRIALLVKVSPGEVEIRIQGEYSLLASAENLFQTDCLKMVQQFAQICNGKLQISENKPEFTVSVHLPQVGQITVLVVDDNADTLQLVRRYTIGSRYHIVTLQDPAQVMSMMETMHPEIVVLDVMMPHIDGWRLLAQLRQSQRGNLSVIVCTIMPQFEIAIALGASGFLQKPVTRQAFLEALDRQVEQMEKESH